MTPKLYHNDKIFVLGGCEECAYTLSICETPANILSSLEADGKILNIANDWSVEFGELTVNGVTVTRMGQTVTWRPVLPYNNDHPLLGECDNRTDIAYQHEYSSTKNTRLTYIVVSLCYSKTLIRSNALRN